MISLTASFGDGEALRVGGMWDDPSAARLTKCVTMLKSVCARGLKRSRLLSVLCGASVRNDRRQAFDELF
jgi:hypothetical protein